MEENFLNLFADILEITNRHLELSDNFREYPEWDSLASLSVVAMIDEEYGVVIPSSEFNKLFTLSDLIEEIKRRKKE